MWHIPAYCSDTYVSEIPINTVLWVISAMQCVVVVAANLSTRRVTLGEFSKESFHLMVGPCMRPQEHWNDKLNYVAGCLVSIAHWLVSIAHWLGLWSKL